MRSPADRKLRSLKPPCDLLETTVPEERTPAWIFDQPLEPWRSRRAEKERMSVLRCALEELKRLIFVAKLPVQLAEKPRIRHSGFELAEECSGCFKASGLGEHHAERCQRPGTSTGQISEMLKCRYRLAVVPVVMVNPADREMLARYVSPWN